MPTLSHEPGAEPGRTGAGLTPAEARAIARDAYLYGFPLVDSYRIMHAYFVDRGGPEYKADWNRICNTARVFTPDDRAVQTPNADTPYSTVGMDLRAEPLVFTAPEIERGRYYSIQFIDAYTFNFAYVGSRTTGNGPGSFVVAGPGWKAETHEGIKAVIRCETELALALYRTQLFNPADIENVKAVQAGYRVQTLSQFLGRPPPPAAPPIDFVAPLTPEQERNSPDLFKVLNFVLQFCPTHPSELALMARFARLGIGAGETFDLGRLPADLRRAVHDGIADAWQAIADVKVQMIAGRVTSADVFGAREHLKNNWAYRMLGAVNGIYGNSTAEATYPSYHVDANGRELNGAKHRYKLRMPPGQLPPANAFWSLTLYELPSSLLSANRLNRYLINSAMLPALLRDDDGGLTIHVQHRSPGQDLESNWLPAPAGPFFAALRLYWPKTEALDGRWTRPPLLRAD